MPAPSSVNESPYGYVPIKAVCIAYVVLFSLSTAAHFGQAIRYRMWWLMCTAVLAGVIEIIGWCGRLWSSFSPLTTTPFLIQIVTTIVAPTPLIAANFVIFGRVIGVLGSQYSRFSAKIYMIVFCSADVIALIVQALGGATAAHAVDTGKNPIKGRDLMLGGIIFQLISITIYGLLVMEYLVRYFRDVPLRLAAPRAGPRMRILIASLLFSLCCFYVRSIYRTIELADGWNGRIIHTQVYFNVLDGAMIILAIITLNIAHPGLLLDRRSD
ncbi:hypothetical protein PLICRDRAFT_422235 [Plicaturopsis crispa FD-325 SS-3]|nr:hypothetical protein PLICRDRAFT_422235 [Plicaturopsis crispa FD-325 SS-3]